MQKYLFSTSNLLYNFGYFLRNFGLENEFMNGVNVSKCIEISFFFHKKEIVKRILISVCKKYNV